MILRANDVQVVLDEDYFEDEVSFVFPHVTREWDCLTIARQDPDLIPALRFDPAFQTTQKIAPIWLSRRMPFYSGNAAVERFDLFRQRVEILFDHDLASRLDMDRDVTFDFDLSDDKFNELRFALGRIFDERDYFSEKL